MTRGRIAALAAIFAVIVACGDSTASSPAPTSTPPPPPVIELGPGEPVVVGVSAALSGDQVNLGLDIADAAEMAAEGRTVAGHPVRVVRVDDGCTDAEQAVAAAETLLREESLVGIVGPMCTTGVQAAGRRLQSAGVVHVSPTATRDELSETGDTFFFRTAWRDEYQAAVQAEYLRADLGADAVVVIDDGEPYGRALADTFAAQFAALGGTVQSRERIARGSSDFATLAQQIVAAAPDAVVFEGLNPEGALLVRALRDANYIGAFVAPDGVLSVRDFIGNAASDAENAVLTGGPSPGEDYVALFRARYQRDPTTAFVLQSHDAMTVLLNAIEVAAEDAGGGRLLIDRGAVATALRDISFDGVTGRIDFNEQGDRVGATPRELGLTIYRVVQSQFVVVE